MSANLDDARRAWEAAKRLKELCPLSEPYQSDARLLLTNAEAEYRAALIDAAERRFDNAGIKVGETLVTTDGTDHFVIVELEADVAAGRVKACSGIVPLWAYADELRPYTAPEAKQMVLFSGESCLVWGAGLAANDFFRLTLSNVTLADLDAMTGTITGTYTIERLG